MELSSGAEVRDEYLSWELEFAAKKLIEEVMLTQKGENVVITADTSSDMRVVNATAMAAYSAEAIPTVVIFPTQKAPVMEPPQPVGAAIGRADVWIEYAVNYLLHTDAFKQAMKNGVRCIILAGMEAIMMVNTIGRVDYDKLIALGELLCEIVEKADKVEVYSSAGTELIAYNQGRKMRHSGKLADTKGEPIMLGGQVSWCPMEETINGKLVFDGALWPPVELGTLNEPVELVLKEGAVTEIHGGKEARIFERWMASFNDPNMYRLAHYSLGFNPGVLRPKGRIVEDERVFGCIEMGLGTQGAHLMAKTFSAASHTDGLVMNPTIILDGVELEKDGVYQLKPVAEAYRDLGVSGY